MKIVGMSIAFALKTIERDINHPSIKVISRNIMKILSLSNIFHLKKLKRKLETQKKLNRIL